MSFMKKVVIITGAGSGIGASTAELFAKECATVAIVDRNEDKLNSIDQRCQEFGAPTLTIKADLSKDQEADTIVKKIIEKFGQLDVLINNAGIMREAGILAENFLETYDETMNINIRSPVRITRFAVPHLIKTKGNIINVSSVAAISPRRPNFISYRISKAGLTHFTRCLAVELAPHGVRVNTVSPGPTDTNLFEGMEVTADKLKAHTVLHRVLETNEIANMIMYLASGKAKGITGSNFIVDNGYLLM